MNSSEAIKKMLEYFNEVELHELSEDEIVLFLEIGYSIVYEAEREMYKRETNK